jgi:hypothetical protein
MPQRRLLVIGSQCAALNRLDFLPGIAERLHALLIDPGPGACIGVALEGRPPGLLIDPTIHQTKAAIERAFEEAAGAGATLILAYIGHGEFPDELTGDFYLMPTDATKPTSVKAVHFAEVIKDQLRENKVGLLMLLDACHAGAGVWQAMERWAQSLRGNIGFELVTAADDRATANAPLARAVVELLEKGDPQAGPRLHGRDVHRLLRDQRRPAQHVAYNAEDPRLSLARNIARDPGDAFWKDSPSRTEILRQTEYFQPTPQLDALVEAARSRPVVVLTGEAGSGKSMLMSALARPEVAGGHVPAEFVQAIAILGQSATQRSLAAELERQLRRSLPGFADAVAEFERIVPLAERQRLDLLASKVLGPLAHLAGKPEVRIILDGFDQLPDSTRETIGELLGARPGHVWLVISTRPGAPGCPAGYSIQHGPTSDVAIRDYLALRRVPEAARAAILDRTGGYWLVARLLSDAVLADPTIELTQLPATVEESYAKLLDHVGAADAWNAEFRPVLGPMAVAGPGPVLPLPLLVHACSRLGGPQTPADVRSVLTRLQGLVVRRDAETSVEQVGFFHATLVDFLLGPSAASLGFPIDARAIHQAMVNAIDALAPMNELRRGVSGLLRKEQATSTFAIQAGGITQTRVLESGAPASIRSRHPDDPVWVTELRRTGVLAPLDPYDPDDPLQRYAFLREADHNAEIGQLVNGLESLLDRKSPIPKENLERSRAWFSKYRSLLAGEVELALQVTRFIVIRTAATGDLIGALQLGRENLSDCERILGHDHHVTLESRTQVAMLMGQLGDAKNALRLGRELLSDRERTLGCDHPDTLKTREWIACWTGEAGDVTGALTLFTSLARDRARILGKDNPDTLETREQIVKWIREATGANREALRHYSELLSDCKRVLGPDHPRTLSVRERLASCTESLGDFQGALRLYSMLLPDYERVLGPFDLDSLLCRSRIASNTNETGNSQGARELYSELVTDCERVLGPEHPTTLSIRSSFAWLAGDLGDDTEALRQYSELLAAYERVLTHDHPQTLTTRAAIAVYTAKRGDVAAALRLSSELLRDRERVLGPDHPDTLTIRGLIVGYTGGVGDAQGALRLSFELLGDSERVLGRDHPDTLLWRAAVANYTGDTGDVHGALRLCGELLSERERILGRDHRDTLATRGSIAYWTRETGDAAGALRLYLALLSDSERVLGPDHRHTLKTLRRVGETSIQCGDLDEGCRRLREGLSRAEARYGVDHALTAQFREVLQLSKTPERDQGASVTPAPV